MEVSGRKHIKDKKTNIINIGKATPSSAFVEVDQDSSQEQVVNLRILDGEEEQVSICCEVKVLRDSGYGSMKPLRKEKCTEIKVLPGK